MLDFRRRRTRFAHQKQYDVAKSRGVVFVELTSKIVSAIALIVLGTAGWLLQDRTERARSQAEQRAGIARKYLPMLRGLTHLEVAFSDAAQTDFKMPGIGPRFDDRLLSKHADEIRMAASSLFFVNGEPGISVVAPELGGEILPANHRRVNLPIRAAALAYSELLRILAVEAGWIQPGDRLMLLKRPNYSAVVVWHQRPQSTHVIDLAPEAYATLRVLLGSGDVEAFRLYNISLPDLAEELQRRTNDLISVILQGNPEVAERYAEMRSSLVPAHDSVASHTARLGMKVIPGRHWLP
ncbi:MAG TPA: hypothetical protein VGQ65_25595 [Thermoanaerobaculia bacterium]|jgi:hypothetical protein|nr:hypothetical protein [Thermoanaerobaculia bacterium]